MVQQRIYTGIYNLLSAGCNRF